LEYSLHVLRLALSSSFHLTLGILFLPCLLKGDFLPHRKTKPILV
jgi:hypothetical protein